VSYVWEAYRFMPRGNTLLVLQGGIGGVSQDFWLLDLSSGRRRQVTSLRATAVIQNFDISADGKSIIFDRTRENADVVLIDRPKE
jgi:Tol biopolymer transport system component